MQTLSHATVVMTGRCYQTAEGTIANDCFFWTWRTHQYTQMHGSTLPPPLVCLPLGLAQQLADRQLLLNPRRRHNISCSFFNCWPKRQGYEPELSTYPGARSGSTESAQLKGRIPHLTQMSWFEGIRMRMFSSNELGFPGCQYTHLVGNAPEVTNMHFCLQRLS